MTVGSTQAYGEASYWDNRYRNESGPFDWYQKYSSLAPLLDLYLLRQSRVLVVGCGNSAFSEGMVDDGYEDVVNIDISSVVIEAMQKKYCNRQQQLKYLRMDVCDMSAFQTGSFDAVIDKGTLDSILCGSNSRQNAATMLGEIGRVLKDKGVYMLITYGAPSYRLPLLKESPMCSVKLHMIEKVVSSSSDRSKLDLTSVVPLVEDEGSMEDTLGKNPDVHYIYVCTKGESLMQNVVTEQQCS